MKRKNITLIIISILILLSIYFVYKKYTIPVIISNTTNEVYSNINKNLIINEELRDVNFCGKNYKIKQITIDGTDVGQRIAEIINYNYNNDTYPKPGSGDKVYENMTEFAQNMKYGFRPYKISESTCNDFTSIANKDLGIKYIKDDNVNYYFSINNISFFLRKKTNFNELGVSSDPDDKSGMGGWRIINI